MATILIIRMADEGRGRRRGENAVSSKASPQKWVPQSREKRRRSQAHIDTVICDDAIAYQGIYLYHIIGSNLPKVLLLRWLVLDYEVSK